MFSAVRSRTTAGVRVCCMRSSAIRPLSSAQGPASSNKKDEKASASNMSVDDAFEKGFWELEDDLHSDRHGGVARPPPRSSTDAGHKQKTWVNFKELLDKVIDGTGKRGADTDKDQRQPNGRGRAEDTATMIEGRLLDMVLSKKKVFKQDKTPLPRGLMPAMYGKNVSKRPMGAPSLSQALDDAADKPLGQLGQLGGIKAHDKQIKLINDLLSTSSPSALLSLFARTVQEYQQDQAYPVYYSRVVANAMHHAYTRFGDPYLAMALFDQCKRMGVQSYLQGCTVDVYNAALRIRWQAWRDVYGMLDLLEEMTINGIGMNDVSQSLVQKVANEMDNTVMDDTVPRWSPEDVKSTQRMKQLLGKWAFK
ncbi:hypothetical protein BC940DRAFT_367418 [Gongronella butleri]|nr:hypothetical protein BC940DRAFT_367418 [Gongronella butleri]